MRTQGKKVAASARERSKLRIRKHVIGTAERARLSIFRSDKHTYAQLIIDTDHKTVVSASTLDNEVKSEIAKLKSGEKSGPVSTKSVEAARIVGKILAQRAKKADISSVVFDRNGFIFTGRVKALADGAREGGLDF
jgi:large subunit ribosomal protein L18